MKVIKLKPIDVTPKILADLEKRNLIGTLTPPKKILKSHVNCLKGRLSDNIVDTMYSSSPRFGSHKLICVGLNHSTQINLNSHPDNEEFIIINKTELEFKPLYLIIGLHKHRELEKKAKNKKISNTDILAIKLNYNDPKTSIFTMFKDTPHCEITISDKGISPIFFVTEPTKLTMKLINLHDYTVKLDEKKIKER